MVLKVHTLLLKTGEHESGNVLLCFIGSHSKCNAVPGALTSKFTTSDRTNI